MRKAVLVLVSTGLLVLLNNQIAVKAEDRPEGQTITTKASEPINVGNKICPVSGEKINEKTKATYEYGGKIYNFCCPMCIDEFKKDPQKYIKKIKEELQAETKEKEMQQKMQIEHETESAGDEVVHRGHQH